VNEIQLAPKKMEVSKDTADLKADMKSVPQSATVDKGGQTVEVESGF
jgi:hypothetical protein